MSDSPGVIQFENTRNKAKAWYAQSATALDWWVLVITFSLVVLGWIGFYQDRVHWLWPLAAMFVLLPLNIHIEYKHMYAELGDSFRSAVVRVVLKGFLWSDTPVGGRLQTFVRGRSYRLSSDRRYVVPLRLEAVEAVVDNTTLRYGVLDELDSNEGYMFLTSKGSAYGQLSFVDQQVVHQLMSKAINAFFGLADESRQVGVTELRSTRPNDMAKSQQMFAESGDPFVFYKNGLPSWMGETEKRFDFDPGLQKWVDYRSACYDELRPTFEAHGATLPWQLFVIKFNWQDVQAKASSGKLSDQQINDLPLIELGRTLVRELSAIDMLEIQEPHIMGPLELAMFIKSSLDPDRSSIFQFYRDVQNGLIPKLEKDLVFVTPEMVQQNPELNASDVGRLYPELPVWPQQHIVAKRDRVLIDNTWFMPIRFKMTPRFEHVSNAQGVHFMTPRGEWASFAQICGSTRGDVDTKMLMTRETVLRSFEEARTRNRMIADPRIRRRQRDADRSLDQISESSVNQRYVPMAVITAPRDREDLLDRRYKVYAANARTKRMRVVKIRGESRVLDAVLSGVLGVARL